MAAPKRPGFRPRRPRINIPLNEHIRARVLRVIDHHGENLGEMSKDEALKIAQDAGLDLYVVSDNGDKPIARVLDYGKYKFELSKKEKGVKKQTGGESKEIKMGYNIDIGDYNTRVNHSKKFLSKGKRVKLNITLRGREMQHADRARQLAERFLDDIREEGTGDPVPQRMSGRSIIVYIVPGPDKARIKKKNDEQAAKEAAEQDNND